MKHKEGNNRHQVSMLCLDDMISGDNPVRLIDAFIDKLDLAAMKFTNMKPPPDGRPPFHPADMLKLYVYGYCNRVRSSRKLEKECERNIEVQWLIGSLKPKYHCIADFRKNNKSNIRKVFRSYNRFLKQQGLFEDDTVAVDGSKFRAQNAKKNNYNEKKVNRHLQYIDKQIEEYMNMLEKSDKEDDSEEQKIDREKVEEQVKKLRERRQRYGDLKKAVKQSDDGQVSTSDPESRALILNKNIVEVSYNVQASVSQTNKLVCTQKTTNKNDSKALHAAAKGAKEFLGKEELKALADKGYHNGEMIKKCGEHDIETFVAYRGPVRNRPIPTPDYYAEKFTYNKEADTYTCPQGNVMKTTGKWHSTKDSRTGKPRYRFKRYRTPACKTCSVKHLCTQRKYGRDIQRGEFADAIEANNKRVDENKVLYRQRQEIVEHPFGTIKRSWGYTYTLLKGIEKVDAEMNFIFLAYNLRRSVSILGVKELIKRLKGWKPSFSPYFWFKSELIWSHLRQFIFSENNTSKFTRTKLAA